MAYTNPNQIGEITEVTGVAKIIRTDGSEEQITLGTEVFQGDIIETAEGGAVNIGFIDDSSFAVSNDARISIDEFVFDPETEGGIQDFSVIQGVFMYTSGLIGRENPDQVEIDTPVGSIGIRGTIIGGHINPDGQSQVSVLEGAIVVRNDGGEQLLTNQYETVTLTSRDVAPSNVTQLDASRIANDYGAVKDVSATLFSSLNDQIQQEQKTQPTSDNIVEEINENDVEEDIKAQENAVEETVSEEPELKNEPSKTIETLKESIEKIQTLDIKPMLNNNDLNLNEPQRINIRERIRTNRVESVNTDTNVNSTQDPAESVSLNLNIINEIPEANNGIAYNSGGPFMVGQLVLSNGNPAVYTLLNSASLSGLFTVNSSTGAITYSGIHFLDYEDGDSFNLQIRAVETSTGRIIESAIPIAVSDVNEAAEVLLAREDVFDLGNISDPSDDIGIAVSGVAGARISELVINDPENETFNVGDLSLSGSITGTNVSELFHIVQDGGAFYLELLPNITIVNGGGFYTFNDGTNDLTGNITTNITFDISLDGVSQAITLTIQDTTLPVGGVNTILSASDNIFIGDDNNNRIILAEGDDNFIFINGGNGHDILELQDNTGGVFNNNFINANLSSIEEIFFGDANTDDTLTIDINTIHNLLATSDRINSQGHREILINTNNTGTVNGLNIIGADGSTARNLVNLGFMDQGTNGEFEVFHHDTHGTVLIDSAIAGADTGGL